jgi:hypothetical protein
MGPQQRKRKLPGGDLCPRCQQPTQIRERLDREGPYSRWFYCTNKACDTKIIWPSREQPRQQADEPPPKRREVWPRPPSVNPPTWAEEYGPGDQTGRPPWE